MFSGLSVRSFVRLSRSMLKFLVKVVFDEAEVQSTWNFVHMFLMIYILSYVNAKLDFWPQFHGPLNIENERASFRLMFLVKVVFDEAEVQSTWNLVHMFLMIW